MHTQTNLLSLDLAPVAYMVYVGKNKNKRARREQKGRYT
jgi:hypothetical protein